MKSLKLSSIHLIPLSFLITIVVGGLILMLPVSSYDGSWSGFITSLFTSTTSTCVTGLTVVNISTEYSLFGQIIILLLIQIGGLGVITVVSMIMLITQKKFSIADRKMLQDSLNLQTDVGVLRLLIRIFKDVAKVETFGAVLYSIVFVPEYGAIKGVWYSIFTSISAFCNAGIDVFGDTSLSDYSSNTLVMATTMFLIVMGGLGYVVWFDMSEKIKYGIKKRYNPWVIIKRFNEHTKLVLSVTLALIMIGAIMVFLAEYKNPNTIGEYSLYDKIINSLFESITFRTAGFSSFAQEKMTDVSCVTSYLLMFIGGSPIGTAGGVKTVTIYLSLLNIISYIRDDNQTIVFERRVTEESMRKATVIVSVAAFTIVVLTLALISTNTIGLQDGLYEVISASATVGLTRGLTGNLNTIGRIIIIVAMYLGRIGPISLAIFFAGKRHKNDKCRYLEGSFFVG